jgi:aldose 1-epimerase
LVLECDAPGVQLYTGNFLNGQIGKNGAAYGKHAGFCLETQHFPDCVNQPKFESCVLSPNETYTHRMVHRFFAE